jgi:hypothetical protein
METCPVIHKDNKKTNKLIRRFDKFFSQNRLYFLAFKWPSK